MPELEEEYLVPEEFDLDDLITRARQQRSDLRADEVSVLAARQGLRAASSSMLPQLNFSAGAGTSYNSGIRRLILVGSWSGTDLSQSRCR